MTYPGGVVEVRRQTYHLSNKKPPKVDWNLQKLTGWWLNQPPWKILPSGNLTWQGKMDPLKIYFLFKMGIFHCYVSFPEGSQVGNLPQFSGFSNKISLKNTPLSWKLVGPTCSTSTPSIVLKKQAFRSGYKMHFAPLLGWCSKWSNLLGTCLENSTTKFFQGYMKFSPQIQLKHHLMSLPRYRFSCSSAFSHPACL